MFGKGVAQRAPRQPQFERLQHEVGTGNARPVLKDAYRFRQEVVERIARRQDHAPDPVAAVCQEKLSDGAAGVGGDHGDVVEIQVHDQVTDQTGHRAGTELYARVHRGLVRAERKIRCDAAEAAAQGFNDLAPHGAGDEKPVHKDDWRAVSAIAVLDGAGGGFEGWHVLSIVVTCCHDEAWHCQTVPSRG
ncbi:Uncharacterised protein [Mycobacteroides abscessus]|nr:Uncharacterised protein [Mycobacteroides abscessus]